jgi:hypothetical protein
LLVVTPDALRSVTLWLEAAIANDVRQQRRAECIWGQQINAGEFHQWGYTEQTLPLTVAGAGFAEVRLSRVAGIDHATRERIDGLDLLVEAVRP